MTDTNQILSTKKSMLSALGYEYEPSGLPRSPIAHRIDRYAENPVSISKIIDHPNIMLMVNELIHAVRDMDRDVARTYQSIVASDSGAAKRLLFNHHVARNARMAEIAERHICEILSKLPNADIKTMTQSIALAGPNAMAIMAAICLGATIDAADGFDPYNRRSLTESQDITALLRGSSSIAFIGLIDQWDRVYQSPGRNTAEARSAVGFIIAHTWGATTC